MYEHIKICLFLYYLYFQNVVSYRIYQLDSAEEKQILPKIRQLLNQNNDELDYQDTNDRPAKNEPMGRSVLVKRIVPHGYVTGEYEYDSKLNTVFKPVARYHVQTPEADHIRSFLKQKEKETQEKNRYAKDLVVLVKEEEIKQNILDQIEKYLGQDVKEQKRNKIKGFKIWNGLGKDAIALLRQTSGQDSDPFAYGKLPPGLVPPSSSSEEVLKTGPSIPFWNYWTYSNTVALDRCPGNLIRVGNMCINSIGHRRSGNPNKNRRSHHSKRRRSIRAARKKHLYGKS